MDTLKKKMEIKSFASTDKNKELLKKYTEKKKNKSGEYEKDFMKIIFNSDDNPPLNKILKLHNFIIVVSSVFEDDKYYPQIVLDECLHEL